MARPMIELGQGQVWEERHVVQDVGGSYTGQEADGGCCSLKQQAFSRSKACTEGGGGTISCGDYFAGGNFGGGGISLPLQTPKLTLPPPCIIMSVSSQHWTRKHSKTSGTAPPSVPPCETTGLRCKLLFTNIAWRATNTK